MSAPPAQEDKQQAKQASPTSDVEEDSESDYSSSEGGGSAGRSDGLMFGNMHTRLRWDTGSRTLNLDVRQYLQNRRKLEAKYKGRLNTNSGQYMYIAQLQRLMSQNTPSLARIMAAERGMQLDGEDAIAEPDRFLPAGLRTLAFRDWAAAPGVRLTTAGRATLPTAAPAAAAAGPAAAGAADSGVSSGGGGSGSGSDSSSSVLRYCVTLRKQPQVLLRRGNIDSWLEGKLDVELQPGQLAVGLRAAARLKVLRLNVTDKQDLQLALGCDYITDGHSSSSSSGGSGCGSSGGGSSSSGLGQGVLTPYLRVSETGWAVRLAKGSLAFTYEM